MDVFLDNTAGFAATQPLACLTTSRPLMSVSSDMLSAEAAQLHRQGTRFVSLRRQQVLRIGEHLLSEVLSDYGMKINCLGFAGGFTGALGQSWADVRDDALRAIDLAHSLDAEGVVVVPGTQGLHTYRHAERNIRDGLTGCVSHARSCGVRIYVPTASILPGQKDAFRPRKCPLQWVNQLACSQVQPMIVIRGRRNFLRLPRDWRYSLLTGACLRLCPRSDHYQENTEMLIRVLRLLCAGT